MADLASFWAGDRLGPIEIASARSFLRHGDRLTVYSPQPIANLPAGVEAGDARSILPSERVLLYRSSASPSLHSNLFRYALMERTDAIWVDLDVIALRPFDFPTEWVFGRESATHVNGAILRLPRTSATLRALRQFDQDTVGFPPHLRGLDRLKFWLRTAGRGAPIDRWGWGSTGPKGLTHFLRETGEIVHALPVSAFYAVRFEDTKRFLEPDGLRRRDLPPDAWAVHLWANALRSLIRNRWGGQIPPESFLGQVIAERLT